MLTVKSIDPEVEKQLRITREARLTTVEILLDAKAAVNAQEEVMQALRIYNSAIGLLLRCSDALSPRSLSNMATANNYNEGLINAGSSLIPLHENEDLHVFLCSPQRGPLCSLQSQMETSILYDFSSIMELIARSSMRSVANGHFFHREWFTICLFCFSVGGSDSFGRGKGSWAL